MRNSKSHAAMAILLSSVLCAGSALAADYNSQGVDATGNSGLGVQTDIQAGGRYNYSQAIATCKTLAAADRSSCRKEARAKRKAYRNAGNGDLGTKNGQAGGN